MEMRAPKGVFDIYPGADQKWQDSEIWNFLDAILKNHASLFNFKEIRTPIFEHLDLFTKGVGEGTDIVSKEMYQMTDKGGRELALRPEGTAPVIRAFIENKMHAKLKSSKFYYIGPMFRYERQQAGRYRQFHQFGAESIGSNSPYADVEIIDMAMSLYEKLGIRNLKLLINCVGGNEARKNYQDALREFLKPKYDDLSEDSKNRFYKNILRILDSKDPKDQTLLNGCPNILDFLEEDKKQHFNQVLSMLQELGIEYEITPKLVRGLDYYDSTVFEVVIPSENGTLTIGGGGRYDGLIGSYGGQTTPAVGFGTGIERIIQTLLDQECHDLPKATLDAYLIPIETEMTPHAYRMVHLLREQGICCDIDLTGKKLKNTLPRAVDLNARFAILIGSEEIQQNMCKVKDLVTRQEQSLLIDHVCEFIKSSLST
jgi:histidyl-tRNA synthetase